MENSIYIGLSKQMVLRNDMQIIANNVANMSTPGYRAQNTLFEEYISDPRGADDALSFVYDRGQYQNTDEGSVSLTGNPLDIALEGPGFFAVQGPGGEVMYSRAGNLQKTPDGTLVTSTGFPLAGNITIPDDSTEVKIDASGAVSNQDGELGQIQIVEFANVQELEPIGNNLYRGGAAGEAENTSVVQGALEGSNVQPVLEMTRMIETLRRHQSVQRVIEGENERLRNAIRKLTGGGQ